MSIIYGVNVTQNVSKSECAICIYRRTPTTLHCTCDVVNKKARYPDQVMLTDSTHNFVRVSCPNKTYANSTQIRIQIYMTEEFKYSITKVNVRDCFHL